MIEESLLQPLSLTSHHHPHCRHPLPASSEFPQIQVMLTKVQDQSKQDDPSSFPAAHPNQQEHAPGTDSLQHLYSVKELLVF